MSNNNLQKKANLIFYQILGLGFGFFAALVILFAILYPKLVMVWKSVSHKLEVLCGCANHFSFTNHPFIFSFIIFSGLILSSVLIIAVVRIIKLHRSTRKYVRSHLAKRKQVASSKLKNAAQQAGIKAKITEIKEEKPIIFSYGYLKPMVCISSSLVRQLQKKELVAVLLHEKHHLDNHEPLKIFAIKVLAKFSFLLPGIKQLSQQYFALSEITADQQATNNFKDKSPLARALCKYLKLNERVVLKKNLAISYFSPTTERINKLIDDKNGPNFRAFTPKLLISILVITFSLISFKAVLSSDQLTDSGHSVQICQQMEMTNSDQCELAVAESECVMDYSPGSSCNP